MTFDIDANGILNVAPKMLATGKDQKIQITSSSGLSKEDVERMAREAETHSAEDKEKREEIEARNQLDGLVYSMEKMLRENGDKIRASERGDVENAIADSKEALESNDKGRWTRHGSGCPRLHINSRSRCTRGRVHRVLRAPGRALPLAMVRRARMRASWTPNTLTSMSARVPDETCRDWFGGVAYDQFGRDIRLRRASR